MSRVLPLLCLMFFFSACVVIPETGDRVLLLTTPEQENKLGFDGYKEVLGKSKVNRDPRLNQILRRVGMRIAAQTGKRDFQWEFTLIESSEANAWCMPGGKVAVYTGILKPLQNEASLAAVLGHEVAHAVLRHSGQQISREMIVNLGLAAADVTLSNNRQHDTLMGLMGAGATVGVILPYSRGHEKEADDVGLRYMAAAGYDPREAIRFWERFSKVSGGSPLVFLSTHPGTDSRIVDLQSRMPEALARYEKTPNKIGIGETF
jgi:metalloendopeptidase OMA1, mitochondrial